MKRLRTFIQVGLLIGLAAGTSGCGGCGGSGGGGANRLEGAGSTFINPMMQEWKDVYKKDKNVEINYQGGGSGKGITKMTTKEVDFGCTDAPLTKDQTEAALKEGGEVVHIPLAMGAVVLAYNLGDDFDHELVFNGEILTLIYLGKITEWSDDRLGALQTDEVKKKLKEMKLPIAPIHRSDSSGTTFIFTDYLTKVSTKMGENQWKAGPATSIQWPKDIGRAAPGSDGVVGEVRGNKGALCYVELLYAKKNNIKYGALKNSKDKTIKAELKGVTAAAASMDIPDDLKYSIVNAPGEDAYPLAGTTWAVVYVKQPPEKAKALADFLTWATSDEGQKHCEKLDYARLPEALIPKIQGKIKLLEAAK
jgi:phosphate ABC transporter phosphate-binding protein